MKNPKPIFAAILALIFCFAGFNLWGYFQDQQANQKLKDREAHERSMATQESKLAEIAAQKERDRLAAEARLEKDRLAAEARAKRDAQKLQSEADAEARRAKQLAEKEARKQAELEQRIKTARTSRTIEGIPVDAIEQVRAVSARYIRENQQEFLSQKFDNDTFNNRRYSKLMRDNTNALMLFSALSPDTDHLQALLDIGLDVNSKNAAGVTPLMFASAYNTPKIAEFLIKNGADKSAKAILISDMNAFHAAAMLNPHPDMVEKLVSLGFDIDAKTEDDLTPLLIAATKNRNLEVVERLVKNGADKEAYDGDGKTARTLVQYRIDGNGDEYYKISDEEDKNILISLK